MTAAEVFALPEEKLIALVLAPETGEFERAKACQRLGAIGSKAAVAALAKLLPDPKFSHYARYGLEPMPSPEAGRALLAALPKVPAAQRAGIINSLGERREAAATEALVRLLRDAALGGAAATALGRIGGPKAAAALEKALPATADAALLCAEGFVTAGQQKQAMALYRAVAKNGAGAAKAAAERALR